MNNYWTRIDRIKLNGIQLLLKYSIDEYKNAKPNTDEKDSWYNTKEKLAQIQRNQFYTEEEKKFLNTIRDLYYLSKWKKKYNIKYEDIL